MMFISNTKKWKFIDKVVLLLLLCVISEVIGGSSDVCYEGRYEDTEGADVRLAAILGLQRRINGTCAENILGVWQHAIAMKWAVQMLNGQTSNATGSFIPNIKIGLDIINDCSIVSKAAFHAGKLMSGESVVPCGIQNTSLPAAPLVGVIGTTTSRTTTIVADILSHHHIPLVGVSATVQELSNKTLYPMFIRAIPSDLQQSQLIIKMAKEFQWFYIMGIHSDSIYGRLGMEEVQRLAVKERICVTESQELNEDSFQPDAMEELVRNKLFTKLDGTNKRLGVVFFGEYLYLMRLLEFIDNKKKKWVNGDDNLRKIHWILTDAVTPTQKLGTLLTKHDNKVFLIGPSHVNIPSFVEYFVGILSDPPLWVSDQMKKAVKQALLVSASCPNFNFTYDNVVSCKLEEKIGNIIYLSAAIDSVYILASLLKQAHSSLCGELEGLCPALKDAVQEGLLMLPNVSLQNIAPMSYDEIGLEYAPKEFVQGRRELIKSDNDLKVSGQPLYSIKQHDSKKGFSKIAATDDSDAISFSASSNVNISSECKELCDECLALTNVSYEFKHGSVILIGFFSIHLKSKKNVFECGKFRNPSLEFIAMEGFVNAIDKLREDTGIDFGYLIIDDCFSPARATKIISNVFGKDIKIYDAKTSKYLEPENIWAVIGALTSPITMAVLPQLKEQHRPMISYSATTPILDNKNVYPYFTRTLPSDTLQAQAIVKILIEIKVTRVGAIVINNVYGQELYSMFKEKAEKELICVEKAFNVTDFTKEDDIEKVLGKWGAKNIKVIVVFLSSTIIKTILNTKPAERYNFHFLASEFWGLNKKILDRGGGKRAAGSLLLVAASPKLSDYDLTSHFQSLNPFHDDASIWLREFWQSYFQCNMVGFFDNDLKKSTCRPQKWSSKLIENFQLDPKPQHSNLATISAGYAISKLMKERQDLVAGGFGPELATTLTNTIKEMELLTTNGKKVHPFDEIGNGNFGFDIYNIQLTADNVYDYIPVGKFQSDGVLQIDRSLVKFYGGWGQEISSIKSSCLHTECQICRERDETSVGPNKGVEKDLKTEEDDSATDSLVVGLVVGCVLLFLLLIVAGIMILLIWTNRLRCMQGKKKISENYNSTYEETNPELPPRPIHLSAQSNYYVASSDIVPSVPDNTSNDETTFSSNTSSKSSENTLDFTVVKNYPPPPRPHHKVIRPQYNVIQNIDNGLPETVQMHMRQNTIGPNDTEQNLAFAKHIQMVQQNDMYDTNQESMKALDHSKNVNHNDVYSGNISPRPPIYLQDEHGNIYNKDGLGLYVGLAPHLILSDLDPQGHSGHGISNPAFFPSLEGQVDAYKLIAFEGANREIVPQVMIPADPLRNHENHPNLTALPPEGHQTLLLQKAPMSETPAPHKPKKYDGYLDITDPPCISHDARKSNPQPVGPSTTNLPKNGVLSQNLPQETAPLQISKPSTPETINHMHERQLNRISAKPKIGTSALVDNREVNHNRNYSDHEPVTSSLVSNTTDTSEEDNNNDKIASSLASNPVSLGFQPRSKCSISSEQAASEEHHPQMSAFSNLATHPEDTNSVTTSTMESAAFSPSFNQILEIESDLTEDCV